MVVKKRPGVMGRPKKETIERYVNVAIPVEVLDMLDEYAKETHLTKTAIYELALREYIGKRMELKELVEQRIERHKKGE